MFYNIQMLYTIKYGSFFAIRVLYRLKLNK